ncbi:MAG: DUF6088 family protein [Erysipelotrichaceae bacterium]|nr:DUF6088 family protein [Erysipelotrichaceae bacterium]
MLLEYIRENYKENEPIFTSDINLPVSETNKRQMFKVLYDNGKIERFDNGIYYLKGKSGLKNADTVSVSDVTRYKYIYRNKEVFGYYSGYTFANQLGLSTQVPSSIEIVSNLASANYRELNIRKQKIILRKPRVMITEENAVILQLLDLLKDYEQYADITEEGVIKIKEYIKSIKIRRDDMDKYLIYYPDRIYKTVYELKLYELFA